jgi:plasmid stabilization system protein ParE
MKYRVLLFRRAQADVDRIRAWIASHSPDGARRWFDALEECILSLDQAPLTHAIAPEGGELRLALRERFFKTRSGNRYRVLYIVAGDEVRIVRIRGPGQPPVTWDDLV